MSTFDRHIKPLTSIRFFAAFFVLLSHLVYFSKTKFSFFYVEDGFIGVTLFFILSGFILAYSYQEKLEKKQSSAITFYFARVSRIYPLHIATLVCALPIFLYGNFDIFKLISNIFLFQAFIPSSDYYFSLNAPSWSISVEFFLYLLFPLLIKFNNRTLILLSIVFILVKLLIQIESKDYQHAILYISPIFRIADFTIGILIYRFRKNIPDNFNELKVNITQLSSLIILLLFIYYSSNFNITYRYDIYYIIPMGLLIFSLSFNRGFIGKILSGRIIVFLGEASFSLYMTHQLVIRYSLKINEKLQFLTDGLLLFSIISLSLLVSIVFYKTIELPMKKWTYNKLILLYKPTKSLVFGKKSG